MSNYRVNTGHQNLVKFVSVAMLSAVAFVLMLFEFPLLPSNYLKMDFGDVPAIVGGVIFGPVWAVVIELVKNVLELLIRGMGTQMGFGNLMNFIIGCAFCIPYCAIIRKFFKASSHNTAAGIIVSSIVSTVITVGIGFAANYFIAPLFFKYFLETEIGPEGALAAAITATAFNPIKCAILVVISALLVTLVIPRIKKAVKI